MHDGVNWRTALDHLPAVHTWSDWGEVFLDVPTWTPVIIEICRRADIPCSTITAGYPGSNAVFIVNRNDAQHRAVVKIYAPLCPEDYDFEREIHTLLQRIPEVRAPRLIAHGILAPDNNVRPDAATMLSDADTPAVWPYVVLSFVPGEAIRDIRDEISERDLLEIAGDLGHRVRRLHQMPVRDLESLDTTLQGWRRYVRQQTARIVAGLRSETRLPKALINQVPSFVEAVLAEQRSSDLVLVSGDITEDHVLLSRSDVGWRVSGLIDFADARVAPREYEWPAVWFSALDRNAPAMKAFLSGYGLAPQLDDAFARQAMAYTFLHEFGALIIAYVLPPREAQQINSLRGLQAALWGSA